MEHLIEALNTALSMEKTGYDLYIKAANSTNNKLGKATLEAIAKKELDHIKAIEEFAANNLHKAIENIHPKTKIDYVKAVMDKLGKDLDKKITKDADLEKAYLAAMELEKNAFNFYKDLHGRSDDSQAKQFFQFLMDEENTHYALLQESLEYLNNPGNWFREQERWIVEG